MSLFRDVNNPRLRDLVNEAPIVSDPVTAVAMNCGPRLASIDAEDAAWRHAFGVVPMHHNADGTVQDCCNDFRTGCEAQRQSIVNAILGVEDKDEEAVELKADPILAMANDHIRLAKPNRTRSHR